MSHPIVVGAADQKLVMVAIDTADNSFKTDLVAADISALVVTRAGSTDVSIASPANKTNPNDAHSDGDVFNDGSGQYIVDITDATAASYVPSLRLQGAWSDSGESTSGLLIGLVHPMTVNSPNTQVAVVGSAMTLADDAITASKFDESTAFPLASADSGETAVARVGADSDTLETLSDQIDGISGGSTVNVTTESTNIISEND